MRAIINHFFIDAFEKFPEAIGMMVTFMTGIVLTASVMDLVNGVLQSLVLLASVIVSVFTARYLHKKTKRLDSNPKSNDHRGSY